MKHGMKLIVYLIKVRIFTEARIIPRESEVISEKEKCMD